MTIATTLTYADGTTIPAGESVRVVDRFSVNGGREERIRFEWSGRLWQCEISDIQGGEQ